MSRLPGVPGPDRPGTGGDAAPADPALAARAEEIYQLIVQRRPEHDIEPTIERVQMLTDLLGRPQDAFRVIQVAGTNGKTSTARMIEQLLREAGLRTGRFTSPHLHTVRERISIDGEPISVEAFVAVWDDVEPYVQMVDAQLAERGESRLSFFEVLTSMGYAAFADAPVDVAVVEVGLGGLWDSTNVADAEVAVFTPIARDHQRWLGDTLEEIAEVKAGIIKELDPEVVVISAEQTEEVASIIARTAVRRRARVLAQGFDLGIANRAVAVGGQLLDLSSAGALYTEIFLPLHGAHQAQNALLALAAVESFFGGGALDGSLVEAAFAAVTSPGRLELARSSPAVLLDAAHNPAGAKALVEALQEAFSFTRLVGVVGIMADKDVDGILVELEPALDEVVITQSTSMRSMDAEDLAEIARDIFDPDQVHVAPFVGDAIALAADLAEQGQADQIASGTGVLVAGSVILAAEARAILGHG
ncbi:bifunctional folylpolyglutamate synthase/dihydrofolate synthase [Pseudactinotalea sp. Z1748]|uniref:bifunctional folylpolyglutamate synthase/dihydrofolate synthase n=1 Tax=Pseudactinotalea sp. Z1748 TaxID=3413027 RepID=UPI003C7D0F75